MNYTYKIKDLCKQNNIAISDHNTMEFDEKGSGISIILDQGAISKQAFLESNHMYFDIEVEDELSALLILNFYKKDSKKPDLYVLLGLLPQLSTRVCFDFDALKGEVLFGEPKSYNLKQVVFGANLPKEEIERIEIFGAERLRPLKVNIGDITFSKELPDFPVVHKILCDKYGQSTIRTTPDKIDSDEALCAKMLSYKNEPLDDKKYKQSQYGGDLTQRIDEGTGFFRTHFDGKRWWLVDPDGYLFISSGLVCVAHHVAWSRLKGKETLFEKIEPKESEFAPAWAFHGNSDQFDFGVANLIRVFGKDYKTEWDQMTHKRLKNWGINTVGAWGDCAFAREYKLPYTITIDQVNPFPTTAKKIFRDFPDVFDPSYEEASAFYAEGLKEIKGDPCMIGYFMRNEPEWAFVDEINIAEQMLAKEENFKSKEWLIAELTKKYETIAKLNTAWKTSYTSFDDLQKPIQYACKLSEEAKKDLSVYSEIMIRKYVEIPAKACKNVDKNHLNLGMRYAFISDPTLIAGWENFDVFSINSYTTSPYNQIDEVSKFVNIPIMIGEFHFGSTESGMYATGLRAVPTQKERGVAYQYYMSEAIKHPYSVGAHYFTLSDQSVIGRFDGENYQIGVVNVTQTPYQDFLDGLCEFNEVMYEIATGNRKPFDTVPKELPRIAY